MKTALRTSSLSDDEIELLRKYALAASVLPVQVSFGDGIVFCQIRPGATGCPFFVHVLSSCTRTGLTELASPR